MPETRELMFSYQELASLLVKAANIHEGLWGVVVRFGFGATNLNSPGPSGEEMLTPTAVIPVQQIGIQRFDAPNNLTVDAAKVNPGDAK